MLFDTTFLIDYEPIGVNLSVTMSLDSESLPPVAPVPPEIPPMPPPRPPLTVGKILLRIFLGIVIAILLLFGVCLALVSGLKF